MRIIGGRWRGRPLGAPDGRDVRPTSDRARESLFNLLVAGRTVPADKLVDRDFGDFFAGTGSVGLEALSRGAARAVFVENNPKAVNVLRYNIKSMGADSLSQVLARDADSPGSPPYPVDIAFLDPPYGSGLAGPALVALQDQGWLKADSLIIVETERKAIFVAPPGFTILRKRAYGAAAFTFLAAEEQVRTGSAPAE